MLISLTLSSHFKSFECWKSFLVLCFEMSSFIFSYNGCLEIMLNLISEKPDRYMIIVATHNEESVRRAVTRYVFVPWRLGWSVVVIAVVLIRMLRLCFSMEELGLHGDGSSVCFGQLLGMCDHVSLTLGKTSPLILNGFVLLAVWNTSDSSSPLSSARFLGV